jgi:hypothetical protein
MVKRKLLGRHVGRTLDIGELQVVGGGNVESCLGPTYVDVWTLDPGNINPPPGAPWIQSSYDGQELKTCHDA